MQQQQHFAAWSHHSNDEISMLPGARSTPAMILSIAKLVNHCETVPPRWWTVP
jgi:hypothetical protein